MWSAGTATRGSPWVSSLAHRMRQVVRQLGPSMSVRRAARRASLHNFKCVLTHCSRRWTRACRGGSAVCPTAPVAVCYFRYRSPVAEHVDCRSAETYDIPCATRCNRETQALMRADQSEKQAASLEDKLRGMHSERRPLPLQPEL